MSFEIILASPSQFIWFRCWRNVFFFYIFKWKIGFETFYVTIEWRSINKQNKSKNNETLPTNNISFIFLTKYDNYCFDFFFFLHQLLNALVILRSQIYITNSQKWNFFFVRLQINFSKVTELAFKSNTIIDLFFVDFFFPNSITPFPLSRFYLIRFITSIDCNIFAIFRLFQVKC